MVAKKTHLPRPPSKGGLNRPLKMVKMIQARCRECNPQGQGKRGWWDECPHDPYFTVSEREVKHPILEERDGKTFKVGENVEIEYVKTPNWKQIADDVKVASGRMVRIQMERGSKFPEELDGYPVCDYYHCWEENPKFRVQAAVDYEGVQTVIGKYHSRDEAAIVSLRLNGVPTYVGVDHDRSRRQQQLNAVNI